MIEFREGRKSDVDLVVDSWLKSYRSSYTAGIVGIESWPEVMDREIRRILLRPGVDLIVACNPDSDAHRMRIDLHGWIAVERGFQTMERVLVRTRWEDRLVDSDRPLVHYVYVKSGYRNLGLARGLFKAAKVDPFEPFLYSCKTPVVSKVARKAPGGEWNPLICRYPKRAVNENAPTKKPKRKENQCSQSS